MWDSAGGTGRCVSPSWSVSIVRPEGTWANRGRIFILDKFANSQVWHLICQEQRVDPRPHTFSCKRLSLIKAQDSVALRLVDRYARPEHPSTPRSSDPQHDVLTFPLTHKSTIPYTPSHAKRVLITRKVLGRHGFGSRAPISPIRFRGRSSGLDLRSHIGSVRADDTANIVYTGHRVRHRNEAHSRIVLHRHRCRFRSHRLDQRDLVGHDRRRRVRIGWTEDSVVGSDQNASVRPPARTDHHRLERTWGIGPARATAEFHRLRRPRRDPRPRRPQPLHPLRDRSMRAHRLEHYLRRFEGEHAAMLPSSPRVHGNRYRSDSTAKSPHEPKHERLEPLP